MLEILVDISERGLVGTKAQWNLLTGNGKNMDVSGFRSGREFKVRNGKPQGRACAKKEMGLTGIYTVLGLA